MTEWAIRFRSRTGTDPDWHLVAGAMDRRGVTVGRGKAKHREPQPVGYATREAAERERRKLELVQGPVCEFEVVRLRGHDGYSED